MLSRLRRAIVGFSFSWIGIFRRPARDLEATISNSVSDAWSHLMLHNSAIRAPVHIPSSMRSARVWSPLSRAALCSPTTSLAKKALLSLSIALPDFRLV